MQRHKKQRDLNTLSQFCRNLIMPTKRKSGRAVHLFTMNFAVSSTLVQHSLSNAAETIEYVITQNLLIFTRSGNVFLTLRLNKSLPGQLFKHTSVLASYNSHKTWKIISCRPHESWIVFSFWIIACDLSFWIIAVIYVIKNLQAEDALLLSCEC